MGGGDTDLVIRAGVARRQLPEQFVVSTQTVTLLAGLPRWTPSALTTVHAGPYDRIGTTYQTLAAWADGYGPVSMPARRTTPPLMGRDASRIHLRPEHDR